MKFGAMMRQPIYFELLIWILPFQWFNSSLACIGSWNNKNNEVALNMRVDQPKKRLGDMKELTFKDSEWIENEDPPIWHLGSEKYRRLTCNKNGWAGCNLEIHDVTCYNNETTDSDSQIKWDCKSPNMTFPYKFGDTDVWCNGMEFRPDTLIRDEKDCELIYKIEYHVWTTAVLAAIVGILLGSLDLPSMIYYFKKASTSSSKTIKWKGGMGKLCDAQTQAGGQ